MPPFASLLASQSTCRIATVVALAQVGLVAADLPAWRCPILDATGLPCPGCGLTHACVALLQGDWRTALVAHPAAPAVLCALALLGIGAALPAAAHLRLVVIVADAERITRATWIVLGVLLGTWIWRLV